MDDGTLRQAVDVIFDKYDSDKSGFIESNELKVFFTDLAQHLGIDTPSDADIQDALKELDTNNDGKVSREELFSFAKALFA